MRYQYSQSPRGQATLEMGLGMVLLLILFVGTVDVGFLLYHSFSLENAAREGLRIGMMGGSDTQVATAIQNATTGLNPSHLSWTITPPEGDPNRTTGHLLAVELWYEDRPPLKLTGLFGSSFTLHSCRKGNIL